MLFSQGWLPHLSKQGWDSHDIYSWGQSTQLADTDPTSVSSENLANIQCDHLSVAFDFCRSPAEGHHRQQRALAWI